MSTDPMRDKFFIALAWFLVGFELAKLIYQQ